MRILFVTTYFEPDSGAAAVRLSRLAKLLHQRGHKVTVLTAMPHYPQGEIAAGYRRKLFMVEERDGLRIIRTWLWATPSPKISRRLISQLSLMFTLALRGLFVKRPDVVFIEGQPVFTALAGWFISKIKRRPHVVNVSDFWPEHLLFASEIQESSFIYRLFRTVVNLTQRGAAGIVALHPPLLESVQTRLGQVNNGHVIYNAVDLNRFRPGLDTSSFRQKYDLGAARLVTFIGTFGTHIDVPMMLDVAARLNDCEDVRFVFIGTGGQREYLQQRLQQPELSNARWIGWIDHEDMPQCWSASHITFWAVHDHPLNTKFLQAKNYEALASGVPVAIAIEGINAQLIADSGAGVTVSFGDKDGLTNAIQKLLDDTDFHRQCSENGRTYAETHFDPEAVASAYEGVLKGVMQDG